MATQIQWRRGNTAQTSTFTGAVAEITVDTDKKTIVVHDGSTSGGIPLALETQMTANAAIITSAFGKANSANVLAQAAYDAANTKVSSTGTTTTLFTVTGNVTVTANTTTSNLSATGATSLAATTVTGNLTVTANTTTSNLSATGATSLAATTVTGALTVTANATVGNLSVTGASVLTGNTTTSNLTVSSVLVYGGVGLTNAVTGTGKMVLDASPTLITPALGTPASGNLASCTADGTNQVGYRNIPQVGSAKSASYTLALTDVGKFVVLTTSGLVVIPASVFAAGDVVSVVNNTTGAITNTCSAITAYLGGTNTVVTSFSLASRGICNILFVTSTVVFISGNVS